MHLLISIGHLLPLKVKVKVHLFGRSNARKAGLAHLLRLIYLYYLPNFLPALQDTEKMRCRLDQAIVVAEPD